MRRRVTSDSLVQSEPSKVTMVLCSSTECLYAARPTQEGCKASRGPAGREPLHQHVED
ncbi:hypothetical protein AVEN_131791-1, partial [Araneus ventricosus]